MQERFFVKTVRIQDGKTVIEHTLAEGRPQAVKQVERIGTLDTIDHAKVRNFLENGTSSYKELKLYSTHGTHLHHGVIYSID